MPHSPPRLSGLLLQAQRWGALRRLALAIGLALLVSAIAMAYLARQQRALLEGSDLYQAAYGPWSAFQLEAETQRLQQDILRHLRSPGERSQDALALRWEILVSRLNLISDDRLAGDDLARTARQEVARLGQPLLRHGDSLFAADVRRTPSADALNSFLAELDALLPMLQRFSLEVQQATWQRGESVRLMLRQHQRDSLILALLQGTLMLAIAAVALHKLHLLHQRRHLEALAEERQHARLAAEQANRTKSAFLANMSHELRTPFHGMLGMLALLARTRLDARQADFVRTAQSSARHLLDVLNDILDLSKLESGHLSLVPGPVTLATLIDDVERLMRPLAQDKGLALHIERAPDLPSVILADGMRIKQILFNLIGNAIKFTPGGTVSLTVAGQPPAAAGRLPRLAIAVRDTGPGISAEVMARLFSRFQQGDDSASRQQGGTGLGLEISRSLARMMGGDITASSVPGAGSCFTLTLEAETVRAAAAHSDPAQPAPDSEPDDALPSLRGLRVLVSEDHEVNQKYLAELLGAMDVEALFCENGQQAVDAARAGGFDLVLLDLHTPVMDGLRAAEAIRRLPGDAGRVPLVAVTADAFEETRQRALRCGMDDFISKPVSPRQLAGVLTGVVRQTTRPAVAARPAPAAEPATPRAASLPAHPQAHPQAHPHGASGAALLAASAVTPSVVEPSAGTPLATAARRSDARDWSAEVDGIDPCVEPCIDRAALRRLARSLPRARYLEISARLLDDAPGTVASLKAALVAGDLSACGAEAHSLKGAAATMALGALQTLAARIEAAAQSGNLVALGDAPATLDEVLRATRVAHATLSVDTPPQATQPDVRIAADMRV